MSRMHTEIIGSAFLLQNPLPKAGRLGDSRGRRASRFQQLTDPYRRLRGFDNPASAGLDIAAQPRWSRALARDERRQPLTIPPSAPLHLRIISET